MGYIHSAYMASMRFQTVLITGGAVITMFAVGGNAQEQTDPGALRVTSVTLTNLQLGGPPTGDVVEQVLQSGGLAGVDVAVPAMSLPSPDKGVAERNPAVRVRLYLTLRAAEAQ